MYIDLSRNNRSSLTASQKKFLEKVVPLGRYIQDQVHGKANFKLIPCPVGINASVVIGDIINCSNWGTHPLAKGDIEIDGKKYRANNLTLLQSNIYWSGAVIPYKDKEYRSYKGWPEFAVNWSDYLVFSGLFDFSSPFHRDQIASITAYREHKDNDSFIIESLIDLYNLKEFDYG